MADFRYSICEPLNPKVVKKGAISPDHILGLFNDFQWDYLERKFQ